MGNKSQNQLNKRAYNKGFVVATSGGDKSENPYSSFETRRHWDIGYEMGADTLKRKNTKKKSGVK